MSEGSNGELTVRRGRVEHREAGPRRPPLPSWLRVKTGKAHLSRQTRQLVHAHGLATVCEQARCPNIGECYSRGTATFLILGEVCTRNCRFCAIVSGPPQRVDPDEPRRVAQTVEEMGLDYVVVTAVTRDDLPDGGAEQFCRTIQEAHKRLPHTGIEVLTPDFQGNIEALRIVLEAGPTIFNHNVETVPRLYPQVRPQADYERSLQILRWAGEITPQIPRKSGLIVGFGETHNEIKQTLADLAEVGVSIVTIGQYLQPTRQHVPVTRYIPPDEFDSYKEWGEAAGIAQVVSGPFVRSSYHAAETARAVLRCSCQAT